MLGTIIQWKHPTAQFVLEGGVIVEWLSQEIPEPTAEDILAWTAEYEAAGGAVAHAAEVALNNDAIIAAFETNFYLTNGREPTEAERAVWRERFKAQFIARLRAR